jgi:signal transduction histidine kinase
VLVFAELLRTSLAGRLQGKEDTYFAMVQEGASRMADLVRGLLDYAQVGSGQGQPVRCEEALDAALADLASRIQETGAQVTRDPLPTVQAEPDQVTRLFQNLLGNALKFCQVGVPPRIHVGCRTQAGEPRFWIQDNGIGIDPRYHDRIFQLFQRLHDREAFPGTGLGLAICKKIVEQQGGRLWVESAAGQGSTFYFTL